MRTNERKERRYLIRIGLLMAFIGVSFIYYMGNSLYYASQKLFEELVIEYADIPEQGDLEELG